MAETLSIHSSHASLSARGHSLKNLFFVPVFETGHLPSRVPPHPPASRLDSTNNADREQRMAQSWKRASAEIRESCAHSCVPNVSPPISGAGYRVVLCSKRRGLRTNKGRNSKEGRGRGRESGGSPDYSEWLRLAAGERPVSPIRFIFGSTFRPTGSQSAPPLSPGTIHLPRGTAYPRSSNHPLPPPCPEIFENSSRSFLLFFSFFFFARDY